MTHIRRNRSYLSGRLHSFRYAWCGIKIMLNGHHNFRIHLAAGFIAIICAYFAGFSLSEWCILILAIGLVLAMETLNTAIEILVDFVSPGYREQAGRVKDVAAGAVLLVAMAAMITGLLLFVPKIL